MIPQDWQGRLKIDYARHLGAGLIQKKKYERILDVKRIKDMQGKKKKRSQA